MTHVLAILAQTTPNAEMAAAEIRSDILLIAAIVFGAIGIWLVLPPSKQYTRAYGAIIALIGFAFLAARMILFGSWDGQVLFWMLAGLTVISAIATISMRSPLYSAIWFALTLLGTAGLGRFTQARLRASELRRASSANASDRRY